MLRNTLLASAAVLGLALATPAQAAVIGFGGGAGAGADPLGNSFQTDLVDNAWGSPGLGAGTIFFNPLGSIGFGTTTSSNVFRFTTNDGAGAIINLGTTLGGFNLETRLINVTDGVAWNPVLSLGGNRVTFTAPAGTALDAGDEFFVNVVFASLDPTDFSWGGSWQEAKVPVPGALALFGVGLLGLGVAAKRRRKAA